MREVAGCFSVSPATVSRWCCRWRQADEEQRRTLGCLLDRSGRPQRMPRLLSAAEQRRICAARRRTGWGPRLLTVATGRSHSTIWKVLKRKGLSRPERLARGPVRRYEWPCPGDLLHADWTLYARFDRPGHAVTGDRTRTASDRRARVRLRLRARGRRRSLAPRLCGAALGLPRGDGHRLHRQGARVLRAARDPRRAADHRQPLELPQEPLPERAPAAARCQAATNTETTPSAERESRTLPPNDRARVGRRHPLPLRPTPCRGAATPAPLLQPPQTTRLPRRPTPDQPRSQRL